MVPARLYSVIKAFAVKLDHNALICIMENRKTHDKTCASKHIRWTQLNEQLNK